MTGSPRTAADRCYRHPDRQSFVLCQRCGRTICPECQTPAAVGVICPEDMKEQRRSAPRSRAPFVTRMTRSSAPLVTYGIMAVCAAVWILQILPVVGAYVTTSLWFAPVYGSLASGDYEPWRMLTSAFTHSPDSIFHILLNMLSVFVFGRVLEPMLGRVRFLALFLLSALGGSLAVEVIGAVMGEPLQAVVGASGAIFGLMGAYFVLARKLGGNVGPLLGIIVLNLLLGFVVQGVSWQAHVGGLVTGGLVALLPGRPRDRLARRAGRRGARRRRAVPRLPLRSPGSSPRGPLIDPWLSTGLSTLGIVTRVSFP
jgi:membrane associated rhomboid family serine protease